MRGSRLRRLASRNAKAALAVAKHGQVPATTYGQDVVGLSLQQLTQIRRLVGASAPPKVGGRSITMVLDLAGDPAYLAHSGPIVKWARQMWLGREESMVKPDVEKTWLCEGFQKEQVSAWCKLYLANVAWAHWRPLGGVAKARLED